MKRVDATVQAFAYVVQPSSVDSTDSNGSSSPAVDAIGITGIRLNAHPWHWMSRDMKAMSGRYSGKNACSETLKDLKSKFERLLNENLFSTCAGPSYIKAVVATTAPSQLESQRCLQYISVSIVPAMAHQLAISCLTITGIYCCFFGEEENFDVGPTFNIPELQRALIPELDCLRMWQMAGVQMDTYLDEAVVALSITKPNDRKLAVGVVRDQAKAALARDVERAKQRNSSDFGNRIPFKSVISKQQIESQLDTLGFSDPMAKVADFGSVFSFYRSDLVRLAEGEWLNDKLIDFEVITPKSICVFSRYTPR
jgi:hypothetical protein